MLWETKRGDYRDKIAATAGPVIIKGKAITGTRCDPSSPLVGGCYITAHDVRHGEEAWRLHVAAVDPTSGRPILDEIERPHSCPFLFGGKNQPSGAYGPDANALYMPLNNVCNGVPFGDQPARGPTHVPGADPARSPVGRIEAISAATGRTLWKYEQRGPVYGSILATGRNLVFSGDVVRRFRAFHAASGKVLWETILNGPVGLRPMTYSVRGRQ